MIDFVWVGAGGGGGERANRAPLPSVGDEVTGKVSRTAGFGVFIDLENGVRGLLHVDEVAVPENDTGRDPNIKAMYNPGDEIKVRACSILTVQSNMTTTCGTALHSSPCHALR